MLYEIRFYRTGWIVRFGLLLFRWNHQDAYRAFSIEWLSRDYLSAGGMTWKEFKLSRQQAAEHRSFQ